MSEGRESPSQISGCSLQSIINGMQISSRATNDAVMTVSSPALPPTQGMGQNEKTAGRK